MEISNVEGAPIIKGKDVHKTCVCQQYIIKISEMLSVCNMAFLVLNDRKNEIICRWVKDAGDG